MADYSRDCSCGGWIHQEWCPQHGNYKNWKALHDLIAARRVEGFIYLGKLENHHVFGCRRGCGVVVWDTEAHIENVCPTFNPVVGDG